MPTVGLPYAGAWRVSQRFGSNAAAYARYHLAGHNGLDVACPTGTPLLACTDGEWWTGDDPTGYGRYGVLTDGDGTQWLSGHASRWELAGGRVTRGQRLGLSGNSGNSTGPHLHFGRRPAGYDRTDGYLGYTNPRPYLPTPYRLALQTGHAPDGGGAPGEAAWTPQLAEALAARLVAAGVDVVTLPGFLGRPAPAGVAADYDLLLALHYDARWPESYATGCCAGRGEFETEPWEADRFLEVWNRTYPAATGIPLNPARVAGNVNVTRYYCWRELSYVTPGVLLEHGVGAPGAGGDAPVLWGDLERVAQADADAVLAYLGLAGAAGGGEEPEEMGIADELFKQVADLQAEVAGLHGTVAGQGGLLAEQAGQIEALRTELAGAYSTIGALNADVIAPLRREVANLTALLDATPLAPKAPTVTTVLLEYSDGRAQEFAPIIPRPAAAAS